MKSNVPTRPYLDFHCRDVPETTSHSPRMFHTKYKFGGDR
jgi:hypothetical protein